VDQIRKVSSLPVVIGFGISTPAQAAEIAPLGDGIVVGSALMKKIEEGQKKGALIDSVSSFVKDLKKAMGSSKFQN
jgi:tryptophan synthase alpha chain